MRVIRMPFQSSNHRMVSEPRHLSHRLRPWRFKNWWNTSAAAFQTRDVPQGYKRKYWINASAISICMVRMLEWEKRFDIPVREKFTCINFLKVVKQLVPGLSSYKLADMEQHYGFKRKADKYKKNIFDIYRDWNHPELRKIVLDYNYEDVYYLAKLSRLFLINTSRQKNGLRVLH